MEGPRQAQTATLWPGERAAESGSLFCAPADEAAATSGHRVPLGTPGPLPGLLQTAAGGMGDGGRCGHQSLRGPCAHRRTPSPSNLPDLNLVGKTAALPQPRFHRNPHLFRILFQKHSVNPILPKL